jgi:hypothetical protein
MLTDMEVAMLKARGFTFTGFEPIGQRYVAKATKGTFRAEALGSNRQDAARKLVAMVTRP